MIKNLNKEERYELRKKGIKIGKYHIYQPRMIRPNAIKFKTILWKCFNSTKEMSYPNFGINFLKNFKFSGSHACTQSTSKHSLLNTKQILSSRVESQPISNGKVLIHFHRLVM